ncbi:N-acetylmuramic acid 6-phosphate etherase [Aquidulcibacter sp.]|uniref:N-acetylmuramic acid 6-phosphate etherase n=1 Tax=Aquidulcibacter sp. TaxID=2052990 RepID=UPI0025BCF2C7|nr:N-acetylmuramic acid 6-phosphate etherase [Aquidulcibacter sp.]MCA3694539.1 N-acetylmuramic acid 6-phosphate etherase [Aquidulcibacter sp.]
MTEAALQAYLHIADWPTGDAVAEMIANQSQAAAAVAGVSAQLARAADEAAARLGRSGRLVYAGAGTSGRIGVQDGVELGPTYGWPKERMIFLMAGGQAAFMQAVEGAEDDHAKGVEEARALKLTSSDVVLGLAASGSTPYTIGVIEAARAAGALTIGLANKLPAPLCDAAEIGILIETGAEVIAGSTRMKAGTAQKIALNVLSTAIMIRLGFVYEGRMVAMQISNRKLLARAKAMIVELTGCGEEQAAVALEQAGRNIRVAILLVKGWTLDQAKADLDHWAGNLAAVLQANSS